MGELSYLPQELAQLTPDGQVAIAMTGRAFDEAIEAGVVALTPLVDNIRDIAVGAGVLRLEDPTPPTVMVIRSSSTEGKYINNWDSQWPVHRGQPQHGMFFSAAVMDIAAAHHGSMRDIMSYAETIGASAITEVSVASWKPGSSFIQAVGDGFALRQRAVRPGPARSPLDHVTSFFSESSKERQGLKRARALGELTLKEPWALTYRQTPQELLA